MDKNVIAAMARWPDVPDVFGWLSLSERGHWRLHPDGHGPEDIGSPQIVQFINRNYAADSHGRWYFQNGPQRVFVRLEAAPYILQTVGPARAFQLRTHTGLEATRITEWWLDESGRLYARTEHGAGLVAGRDTALLFESMTTIDGTPLLDAIEHHVRDAGALRLAEPCDATIGFCEDRDIPRLLGFVACPSSRHFR